MKESDICRCRALKHHLQKHTGREASLLFKESRPVYLHTHLDKENSQSQHWALTVMALIISLGTWNKVLALSPSSMSKPRSSLMWQTTPTQWYMTQSRMAWCLLLQLREHHIEWLTDSALTLSRLLVVMPWMHAHNICCVTFYLIGANLWTRCTWFRVQTWTVQRMLHCEVDRTVWFTFNVEFRLFGEEQVLDW